LTEVESEPAKDIMLDASSIEKPAVPATIINSKPVISQPKVKSNDKLLVSPNSLFYTEGIFCRGRCITGPLQGLLFPTAVVFLLLYVIA
jgi:hypothetical protein